MKTINTNTNHFPNKREAMLDLIDVNEDNVFSYAKKLMISLRLGTIDSKNYELLTGDLYLHCLRNNIPTKIEHEGKIIFDLF